jgi:hypothetical protein
VANADLVDLSCSALLSSNDIKSVVANHNEMISELQKFESDNADLKREIDGLKETLDKELEKEQPNIKEITDRIVKQELETQSKKFND